MASRQIDGREASTSNNHDANNRKQQPPPPPPPPPKPTRSQVLACQFSSWYTTFRAMDSTTIILNNTTAKKIRKNVTIESKIVRPLPSEFIEYLSSDGVRLPECANRVSSCMNDGGGGGGGDDGDDGWDSSSDDNEDDDDDDDDDGDSNNEMKKYNFPTLTNQIQSALTALGGGRNLGCMPKLNWSSPKDATWINCGSMKCTKVGDVYLLLKSSDFVGFDLEKVWDDLDEEDDDGGDDGDGSDECCDGAAKGVKSLAIKNTPQDDTSITSEGNKTNNDASSNGWDKNQSSTTNKNDNSTENAPPGFEYELVLRKWCNLHPSMEFRCFVYNHELAAVSQRHPTKFYPHLQPPSEHDDESDSTGSIHHPSTAILHSFFQTYVRRRFADGKIHKYVVDLYLDSQERVWVVDFNVWGSRTDGLLFDWDELMVLGTRFGGSIGNTSTHAHDGDENDDEEDGLGSIPMPEMRVVTRDMKSMTYDPLSSYRGPTDAMDLVNGGTAGNNGGDGDGDGGTTSFEDFMRQCVRPSEM